MSTVKYFQALDAGQGEEDSTIDSPIFDTNDFPLLGAAIATSRLEYEQQRDHNQEQLEINRREQPLEIVDLSDSSNASMDVEVPSSYQQRVTEPFVEERYNQSPYNSTIQASPNRAVADQAAAENESGSSFYDSTPDLSDSENRSPIIIRTCSVDPSLETQEDSSVAAASTEFARHQSTTPGKYRKPP